MSILTMVEVRAGVEDNFTRSRAYERICAKLKKLSLSRSSVTFDCFGEDSDILISQTNIRLAMQRLMVDGFRVYVTYVSHSLVMRKIQECCSDEDRAGIRACAEIETITVSGWADQPSDVECES